jgi:nucleoside-diphosphate-sugar epimerase
VKLVITGNMGYVGPRVVRHLRNAYPGATLVGIDTGWFAPLLTNASVAPETQLDVQHFADVRDVTAEMLAGAAAVIHLAGISNDPIGNQFEQVTMEVNASGTAELARRAKAAGVRHFVFASSCSVYGFAEEGARTETSSVSPLTAYARSKVAAEDELRPLASRDFTVTSLRFATACGMSERLRLDLVVNQFVAYALASRTVTVLSDGTPWRPLIDVDDMARAIEWAAGRDGEPFLVVNTGRNEANYTVREVAEAVAELIPGCSVSINPNAPPDRRSYRVDFSLFRRLAPEYQPRVSLAESIRAVRDGLLAMQYDEPDVQQSPLIRLRTLVSLQRDGLLSPDLRWSSRAARAAYV